MFAYVKSAHLFCRSPVPLMQNKKEIDIFDRGDVIIFVRIVN